MLDIKNALYTGICIYDRLSRTIVEIDGKIVSLEDKKNLSLYLGIIHTENCISNLLIESDLKKDTNITYKKLDNKTFLSIYNKIFKDSLIDIDIKTIEDYFMSLLNKDIVMKLNSEYNFNPSEFINIKNKQLIKK